jgi:hypothetical protein
MKMYCALFAIAFTACATGQGEVDVTTSHDAAFPGVPADVASRMPPGGVTSEADLTLDLKDDIDSLAKFGTVSAAITKNTISGSSLAVVRHITVTMATQDGKMPVQPFADVQLSRDSTDVELVSRMGDAQVLAYLREGKVVLHLTLTGNIPEQSLSLTHTLVAHVNIAVNGSVLKF